MNRRAKNPCPPQPARNFAALAGATVDLRNTVCPACSRSLLDAHVVQPVAWRINEDALGRSVRFVIHPTCTPITLHVAPTMVYAWARDQLRRLDLFALRLPPPDAAAR